MDLFGITSTCTLSSAERLTRAADFDRLFTDVVLGVEHLEDATVRLALRADAPTASRAAELAARETACCSFFSFVLTAKAGSLILEVSVPDEHLPTLNTIAARAEACLQT